MVCVLGWPCSQSYSHAHLFCVLPHRFPSKRCCSFRSPHLTDRISTQVMSFSFCQPPHCCFSMFQPYVAFWTLPKQSLVNTVEPHSTDTCLIQTPRYYGQFRFPRRKARIFFLKLIHLLRTPVNTDNGHFSVSRATNSYTSSTPLYGHCLYLCIVYCHCHDYVLIRDFVPWSNDDRFRQVNTILLLNETVAK